MSVEPAHLFYKPSHEFGLYDNNVYKGKVKYEKQKTKNKKRNIQFCRPIISKFYFFYYLEETNSSNNSCMYEYWAIYKYMDGYICDDADQRVFKNISKF